MPTTTTNYAFNKPLVNNAADEDLWGAQTNTNWDSLDGILPAPVASKFGAIVVQSTDDASLEIITSQGAAGEVLVSAGADALPIFTALYPVGSIYMNKAVSTNPATLFGFGTWTAIEDVFIVGRGSTYSGTGGSATESLTEGMLPTSVTLNDTGAGDVDNNVTGGSFLAGVASGGDARSVTVALGSGNPLDIIPPYQAVYTWERTA